MLREGRRRDSAATLKAKRVIAGSKMAPIRPVSNSPPKIKHPIAVKNVLNKSAEDKTPRPRPRSLAIGFSNTPKAKMLIAPLPTIWAINEAATIHHRFRKMLVSFITAPPCDFNKFGTWPRPEWSDSDAVVDHKPDSLSPMQVCI